MNLAVPLMYLTKFRFIHVKLEVWNENQKPDLAFGRFAKFGPLENPSWDPWGPNLEVGSPFFGTLVEALNNRDVRKTYIFAHQVGKMRIS